MVDHPMPDSTTACSTPHCKIDFEPSSGKRSVVVDEVCDSLLIQHSRLVSHVSHANSVPRNALPGQMHQEAREAVQCCGKSTRQCKRLCGVACLALEEGRGLAAVEAKNLVGDREVEVEGEALDAADLAGGEARGPFSGKVRRVGRQDRLEVAESMVPEVCFLADLTVDLQKTWLLELVGA